MVNYSDEALVTIERQYNSLKNDKDRLRYILQYKDVISLMLDNDNTTVCINWSELEYDRCVKLGICLNDLDNYIGNSEGLISMLDILGIKTERC